ncbi:asparaginase [Hwanghaeella sp.]|uniref:asparaginase n=1 Tax=Hwanghaeella sp. TaxID=2605943 RepID=UPI003CCB9723
MVGNHIVIGLGGTISLAMGEGRAVSRANIAELLTDSAVGDLKGTWSSTQLMTVNSADITPLDIVSVAQFIAGETMGAQGVVVTTGTDTLEEVAYGLSLILGKSANVIVTGAMRPPFAPDFDGTRNLRFAAGLIEERAQRGERGVLIAIGGSVLPPARTIKTSTHSLNAFSACPGRDKDRDAAAGPIDFSSISWRELNIPILSMATGYRFDPAILEGTDGLVVACPGYASLSSSLFTALAEWINRTGLPVVLASRCHDSGADLNHIYPGYVDRAEDAGFHVRDFLGLSPEKARLRLLFRMNGVAP